MATKDSPPTKLTMTESLPERHELAVEADYHDLRPSLKTWILLVVRASPSIHYTMSILSSQNQLGLTLTS